MCFIWLIDCYRHWLRHQTANIYCIICFLSLSSYSTSVHLHHIIKPYQILYIVILLFISAAILFVYLYLLRHTKSFKTNNVTVISTSPISRYYCFFSFLLLRLCSCSLTTTEWHYSNICDQIRERNFVPVKNQRTVHCSIQFKLSFSYYLFFFCSFISSQGLCCIQNQTF